MSQTVTDYYVTNYTHCTVDKSFLGSWQGLAHTSHLTQIIAVPIQILTFYLIIKKSPLCMKYVKGPLLVSHFLCSLLDFSLGTLSTPYLFFPELAVFGVGVLNFLQIPILPIIIILLLICFAAGLSLVYLFEVRSSSIPNNRFRIERKSTRVLYYTANYSVTFLLVLLKWKLPEDQETAKLEVLKSMPCPTNEFFTQPTFILLSDPFWAHFITFYVIPAIIFDIAIQIAFFFLCCVYHLYIVPSKAISSKTRRLQNYFFIGIVIQTGIPFIIVAITYTVMIVAIKTRIMNQAIMNMCMVTFGIHGISESLAILMVHGTYRRIFWEFLKKRGLWGNTRIENGRRKILSIMKNNYLDTRLQP